MLLPRISVAERDIAEKDTFEMAKGQKRSNREVRKPKQDKTAPKVEGTFVSQIRLAANIKAPRSKR